MSAEKPASHVKFTKTLVEPSKVHHPESDVKMNGEKPKANPAHEHDAASLNNLNTDTSTTDNNKSAKPIHPSASSASLKGQFALYEEDPESNVVPLRMYLRGLSGVETSSDPVGSHGGGKAKLGTLFGVYLPSIQHILGVQMFLRLLWVVGIAGLTQSFSMVFVCCVCTFLTSISISAIATNGVIDSGGAYFMISRNLGPEFGGAIGLLYYLANTVATAMYLVGGIEILLTYMAPGLPKFESAEPHEPNFNNFRIYGTIFLILLFAVCTLGIRFVQFFAPVSLACVILSILSVFVGGITAKPSTSPMICLLGEKLLKPDVYRVNGSDYCNKSMYSPIWNHYCEDVNLTASCDRYFDHNEVQYVPGIPGFSSGVISRNLWPQYMDNGQAIPGKAGKPHVEISQDLTTTFFVLLAIFFPSVTGIMTGANMSGDLADPQKSIPVGTIAAQLTTSAIYLTLVVVYGGTIHGALLRDKYGESIDGVMVVAELAWPSRWILLIGSFTSCVGAGLQCLCTAPRLLQSIAKDNLLPFLSWFSTLTSRHEPFRALILTTIIAECAILIGGIDYIAPVVDFFFLTSYCFVNVACALQTLLKAPNWRPRFRFYHWTLAILGALLNLFIMFSTYWYYAIVVLILCAALYKYIEFKGAKKEWGDGMRGLALSTAQYSLLRVEEATNQHPKNWRPQLLLLLKMKEREGLQNRKMLHLANQLKAGRGLTMVATILEGDLNNPEDREKAIRTKEKLKTAMQESKVKGFTEVPLCENLADNVGTVIQCVGMGGLRPNTVLIGWPYNWRKSVYKDGKNSSSILEVVHRATAADMCLLVVKGLHMFPDARDQLVGYIDVWWIIHDGGLLILLPFLLRQHKTWRQCTLRVFAVAEIDDNTIKMKEDLQNWVYQLRIAAEIHVVELSDNAIAPYTYERTMVMEERARLATELHLTNEELLHEPQLLADRYRNESTAELFHRASIHSGRRGTSFIGNEQKPGPRRFSEFPSPLNQRRNTKQRKLTTHVNMTFDIAESDEEQEEKKSEAKEEETEKLSASSGESSVRNSQPSEESSLSQEEIQNYFSLLKARKMSRKQRRKESKQSECSIEEPGRFANLDKKKVRKMNMAIKLNKAIRDKSSTSRLVILNLPKPPMAREAMSQYMEYLEVLTENLERVLLVRGCGKEVITIYS